MALRPEVSPRAKAPARRIAICKNYNRDSTYFDRRDGQIISREM
jgi:hypothetical protein